MKTSSLTHIILGAIAGPLVIQASDVANIKAPLHPTAANTAAGSVIAHLASKKSQLEVKLRDVSPLHTFAVEVGGIVQGTVTSSITGRAEIRFRTPAKEGAPLLDFDPRGQTLRILDGAESVLEGVISGPGEDDGSKISERIELKSTDDNGTRGKATVQFTKSADGRTAMNVDLVGAGDGPFVVRVDGVERAETEHRGRRGSAIFESEKHHKGGHELEFEPRGAEVEILKEDRVVFSGKVEAQVPGINVASPSITGVVLPSTGVDSDGVAVARLKIDQRARKHFSVEIEAVPVGAYDLTVDGGVAGTIQVVSNGTGTKGEVELESGDDDSSEQPLTFDPIGKTLAIGQGGTIYFSAVFNPNVTGSGVPAAEAPPVTAENLTNTGLDSDAHANARYVVDERGRHKFSVEVEAVPVGTYALAVAGRIRGTIVAALVSGKVKGEIEFDSEVEPGHEMLNFDPRGQTIELSGSAGLYFTHIFGTGSAPEGEIGVVPFDVTVALLNAGQLPLAKAKAELQREATGHVSFEVELEDAPVGSYELLVDGVVEGTIDVVSRSKGTRGRLEFENEVKEGRPFLDFVIAGKEVAIRQAGVMLFSRVFPNP